MIEGSSEDRLARAEQRISDIDDRGSRGMNRVAAQVTRLEQHAVDIDKQLQTILPVATTVMQLMERMDGLRRDLRHYHERCSELDRELERRDAEGREERLARDAAARQERQESRRVVWVMACTLLGSLVAAGTTVIVAVTG